jgi:hypothetical protein
MDWSDEVHFVRWISGLETPKMARLLYVSSKPRPSACLSQY